MIEKWIFEPTTENFVGWYILKDKSSSTKTTSEDEEEYIDSMVGCVYLTENIETSKRNAALVSTAPELLDICKRLSSNIDKMSPLKQELDALILKAEGKDDDNPFLTIFDEITDLKRNFVIDIDADQDKINYIPEAKMNELFFFEEVEKDKGMIKLNIIGDYMYEDPATGSFYDVRLPIGYLLSFNVFKDFIQFMDAKYPDVEALMVAWDKCGEDTSLSHFLQDIFMDEFSVNYNTKMSMKEYFSKYGLVHDTETLYIPLNLPKFLENCPHTYHLDITVNHRGKSVTGIIFYRAEDENYYVISGESKSKFLFMINNNDVDLSKAQVEFVDLLR